VARAPLAEAAACIARLLPARSLHSSPTSVVLRGDQAGLSVAGADGEVSVQVRVPAAVHCDGEVAVPRRVFADTLAALDTPEVRLAVEGARLAIRTSGARFALPSLDVAADPGLVVLPPTAGVFAGSVLRSAAAVAGASSHDGALPIFTGVRITSSGGRLSLVATDRYRMAAATVPWQPAEGADDLATLVPAALVTEICRQASSAETVRVHASGDRFGLAWDGCTVVATSLAGSFPDRQLASLLDVQPACVIEVEADALSAAAQRALPYAGPHSQVALRAADGLIQVSGRDPLCGESEESVKASVRGTHLTVLYQVRFLVDALRPFAGQVLTVRMQAGMRATAFTAPAGDLTYLVVPMRDKP